MPKTVREVPPPLELLCLNALWSLTEGNVKDVQQIVARTRPLAYTTIMTVLDRLVRKGLLDRRKVGRAYVYMPQTARDAMRRTALRELLEGFFDGSEMELVRFLAIQPLSAAAAGVDGTLSELPAGPEDGATGGSADARIDTVLL
jgi:predicted transcriptional regulator